MSTTSKFGLLRFGISIWFLSAALEVGSVGVEGREIPLDGVLNTRDLGGLRTEDGHTVRTGQLIRSGEIDDINAEGKARLDSMRVTTIVDLRTTSEASASPASWPGNSGPARYHFPLMEKESEDIDQMRASIKAGLAKPEDTEALFFGAFGSIATDYSSEIRELFEVLLAQPEGEAVLFHCSGGKDRTGVATAVVLSALGVKMEDIEADFMMSNVQKDAERKSVAIAEAVNEAQGTKMPPEAVWPTLGVRKEYLDEFYGDIEEDYGSMDLYLKNGLGLTEAKLKALRARYLE